MAASVKYVSNIFQQLSMKQAVMLDVVFRSAMFNKCQRCIHLQKLSCHDSKNVRHQHKSFSRLYQCRTARCTSATGSLSLVNGSIHPVISKNILNKRSTIVGKNSLLWIYQSCILPDQKVHYCQKTHDCTSIAKPKKENIWTVPNMLTMSRIVLTPVIGYLVLNESYVAAVGLFTFAGVTDLLDGYIARNFKNQMSAFGTALDPLADKILITVLTVTLTLTHLIPVPLAVLIIGRDVFLVSAGFVIRYISLPPPRTVKRYFDVTNPTATLHPSLLSKINTALQLSLVCLTLAAPVFDYVNHPALQCLWYITGATTLASGITYVIYRKQAVQFLHKTAEKSMK